MIRHCPCVGSTGSLMYGLVNRAFEELIIHKYGAHKWSEVREKAKVEIDAFISNEPYPDEVTYKLIDVAHETLGVGSDDLIREFGVWFVVRTAKENYGLLLGAAGATLKEFLINLPHFHARVQLIYPKLQPPEFECTDIGETSLKLHYFTQRLGLVDFVVGLLSGLGELYGTPVTAVLLEEKAKGADHDVFAVSWTPAPGRKHHDE